MNFLSLLDESDQFFSESQEHLLRALLMPATQSDLNARLWARTVDFEQLDPASFRLIPALYSRCGKSGALNAYSGRMKGIYRNFFYRNHRLIARIRQTLAILSDHGIEFIVFKGTSVLIQHHKSVARRSFSDCDILIRERDQERADSLITDAGWTYAYEGQNWRTDTHSRDYVDGTDTGFDLHWYALYESCVAGIDDGLWERSRQLDWDGLKIRVLSPEDELLVAACNGVRNRDIAQLDWLYDASLIFEATAEFDWSVVAAETRKRQLGDTLVTALALLGKFVPGFDSGTVERQFLPEIGSSLATMIAQNRNFSFDAPTRQRMVSLICPDEQSQEGRNGSVQADCIARVAASRSAVKFIRYEPDDEGWIRRLRFYRDLLEFIPNIFEMRDQAAFDDLAFFVSDVGEVMVELPAGTMRVPDEPEFADYDAAITISESRISLGDSGARQTDLAIRVSNTSSTCWSVFPDQRYTVGLSYHLMDKHGDVLEWDMPRLDLLPRRRNHVTVLLPGSSLDVDYVVMRPPGTGTFHAGFDIVHEHVKWFSNANCKFPTLEIVTQ